MSGTKRTRGKQTSPAEEARLAAAVDSLKASKEQVILTAYARDNNLPYRKLLKRLRPPVAGPAQEPPAKKPPPGPLLLRQEEESLVEHLKGFEASNRCPPSWDSIRRTANLFLLQRGDSRLVDNAWIRRFLRRHPTLDDVEILTDGDVSDDDEGGFQRRPERCHSGLLADDPYAEYLRYRLAVWIYSFSLADSTRSIQDVCVASRSPTTPRPACRSRGAAADSYFRARYESGSTAYTSEERGAASLRPRRARL